MSDSPNLWTIRDENIVSTYRPIPASEILLAHRYHRDIKDGLIPIAIGIKVGEMLSWWRDLLTDGRKWELWCSQNTRIDFDSIQSYMRLFRNHLYVKDLILKNRDLSEINAALDSRIASARGKASAIAKAEIKKTSKGKAEFRKKVAKRAKKARSTVHVSSGVAV